ESLRLMIMAKYAKQMPEFRKIPENEKKAIRKLSYEETELKNEETLPPELDQEISLGLDDEEISS
ncbi:17005_t:CDS:2, partial [Racocetra fulgida]